MAKPPELDKDVVSKVAQLSSLQLDKEEEAYYVEQLEKVLSYVNKLDDAPDHLAKGWRDELEKADTFERQDQIVPSLDQEKKLRDAPEKSATAIKVPKVID